MRQNIELGTALAAHYGFTDFRLTRVLAGSQTDNFLLHRRGEDPLFVKYGRVDPAFRYGEPEARSAVEISEFARQDGVPAPRVVKNLDQEKVTVTHEGVITVWEYIEADPQGEALTEAQAEQAGWGLGRMHSSFSALSRENRRQRGDKWIHTDPAPLVQGVTDLIGTIDALPQLSDADRDRKRRLERRRQYLEDLPQLRARLPRELTRGVGHGDYSRVNLLWRGPELAAVLDFQGHDIVPAWELGRIAFDALTTASSDNWREIGLACARGYTRAGNRLPEREFLAAPLMMALHALCSLHGIHEHYHDPNPIPEVQAETTQYWTNRDEAVMRVLENLDAIQDDWAGLL